MRNKKIDLNEELRKVSCDILVIGGGGAGLRAAIELSRMRIIRSEQ
jgi:succinate dehydrogenase/fumarate reductase flavoprotein subunit